MTMSTLPMPTYDPTDAGNYPGDGPLRVGGVTVTGLPSTAHDLPSTRSECAARQQAALQLARDLWGGTQLVRAAAEAYLPKAPGEDGTNYSARLMRSVFFNVYKHTIKGQIGFIFRKDPALGDDVPAAIKTHAENIDLSGTHFDVFTRDIATDAQNAGHAAILVDYPDTGGQQLSLADELPLRPYWISIKKDDILSWRTTVDDGRMILTQLVLRESQMVPDGAFGEKQETQYRVLYRDDTVSPPVVGFQLLGVSNNNVVFEVRRGIYGNQTEIPVAEIPSSGRRALFESDPPLLDLAYLNVAHYQQWSDYATSLHKTCVPIWVESGVDMEPDGTLGSITLGPNTARRFTNPQAKAEYVSHSGQSLGACKQALDDIIRDMAVLGLAALASQKRAAETAAAKQIDKDATDSELSVTARGIQDGLERALTFHANYLKLPAGGSVEINRDFEDMTMRAEMLVAYVTAVSKAGLPVRILLDAMQQGGLIGPDEDLDALEADIMANQAAIAAQEQQAKADALAAQHSVPGSIGVAA